jgi:small-conductance mechanosensitive channel
MTNLQTLYNKYEEKLAPTLEAIDKYTDEVIDLRNERKELDASMIAGEVKNIDKAMDQLDKLDNQMAKAQKKLDIAKSQRDKLVDDEQLIEEVRQAEKLDYDEKFKEYEQYLDKEYRVKREAFKKAIQGLYELQENTNNKLYEEKRKFSKFLPMKKQSYTNFPTQYDFMTLVNNDLGDYRSIVSDVGKWAD